MLHQIHICIKLHEPAGSEQIHCIMIDTYTSTATYLKNGWLGLPQSNTSTQILILVICTRMFMHYIPELHIEMSSVDEKNVGKLKIKLDNTIHAICQWIS